MSAEKCAVPNCNNPTTTGIPFPKQPELREKWLKSLEIPDSELSPNSFVCPSHFGDGDDEILEHLQNETSENNVEEFPSPVLPIETSMNEANERINYDQSVHFLDQDSDHTSYHQVLAEETAKSDLEESLVCRLCMIKKDAYTDVFDVIENDLTVASAISHCIPLIKITRQDGLSRLICNECLNMIKTFHQFRETCIKNYFKQRETIPIKTLKRKLSSELTTFETSKRLCLRPESELMVEKPVTIKQEMFTESIPENQVDSVEIELMRVIEGKLPEEMKSADNIIIEVRSDDESEEQEQNQETQSTVINQNNILTIGPEQLKLPQGIKVVVNQASKTGVCNAKVIKGVNNTDFCLIDNYLFEYRLCKGNVRYLKCVVSKCRSTAQQNMLKPGVLENTAVVKVSHNHPPLSEDERKKQMFLNSMRRKMQSDKTLNFRSVYEEFCEKDPDLARLVPLKTVINQICCQQMSLKLPNVHSFDQFYNMIENDEFQKLHFTHTNKQFYQERFECGDGSKAVIFANRDTIEQISSSKIMYVDASFRIDTKESFNYHLVSILVWVSDSYYPILFALVNEKSQEIYKAIFGYLHDVLAPKLRPEEIVTDYEACLYYALGEIYLDSHIGGSVFYYTQNLYKKICSLNLSRELETNSCFRSTYHMILMLPLLPVNTILDGLSNIELQAAEMGQAELAAPIFEYVRSEWMGKVTPELFCVHRLENRINENVIAPFKKLRDFLMLSKGKMHKHHVTIVSVVEKLIELEGYLQVVYSTPSSKKSFSRDLTTSQKRNVIRAWQFIESHPKININHFFTKVLGYIKCMENQLWIWGFYRYTGEANDELINAANFSIINSNEAEEDEHVSEETDYVDYVYPDEDVVVDVVDQKGGFITVGETSDGQVQLEVRRNEQFHNTFG